MRESFASIYTRLYDENKEELETLRLKVKEESKKTIFIVIIAIIAFIVLNIMNLIMYVIPVVIILMIIVITKSMKKTGASTSPINLYKTLFKEKIIRPLITNIFEGAEYSPNQGWSIKQYKEAKYKDCIDRYSSEDLIISPIKLGKNESSIIEFCEVHTESESRDKDGHTTYTTIFYGLASKMKISKSIKTSIYIRRNWSTFGSNKIKLDSSEFEKKFDVESKDKIMAVRVLTSDVMAEMLDMREKYGYTFEIHIIEDTIYMRVFTGEVFEPNVFKHSLEYSTLEKYYQIIDAMMNLSKHIYRVIDEIEV